MANDMQSVNAMQNEIIQRQPTIVSKDMLIKIYTDYILIGYLINAHNQ